MDLITKLLIITPKFLFDFLSKLLDIDKDIIENKLTPTELIEICKKLLIQSFLSDIPIISIMKIDTKSKIQLFPGKEMT